MPLDDGYDAVLAQCNAEAAEMAAKEGADRAKGDWTPPPDEYPVEITKVQFTAQAPKGASEKLPVVVMTAMLTGGPEDLLGRTWTIWYKFALDFQLGQLISLCTAHSGEEPVGTTAILAAAKTLVGSQWQALVTETASDDGTRVFSNTRFTQKLN